MGEVYYPGIAMLWRDVGVDRSMPSKKHAISEILGTPHLRQYNRARDARTRSARRDATRMAGCDHVREEPAQPTTREQVN